MLGIWNGKSPRAETPCATGDDGVDRSHETATRRTERAQRSGEACGVESISVVATEGAALRWPSMEAGLSVGVGRSVGAGSMAWVGMRGGLGWVWMRLRRMWS